MEPTEAMVKRHVAEARRILQSDRLLAKLNKHFPDEPDVDPASGPPAPALADPKDPPKRTSIWWGDSLPSE
jgi:hypothetical protein